MKHDKGDWYRVVRPNNVVPFSPTREEPEPTSSPDYPSPAFPSMWQWSLAWPIGMMLASYIALGVAIRLTLQ
jgi:hypothetical protein